MRKRLRFLHEKEYSSYFNRLIDLERKEEMEFHKREISRLSPQQREKKGRAIIDLRFTKKEISSLGKILVYFNRDREIKNTEIKDGDVVLLSHGNPLKQGVFATVEFISKNVVCLMFERSPRIKLDRKMLYRVDLYVNETTYSRMKEALAKVRSKNISFPLDILLGHTKPTNENENHIEKFFNTSLNDVQKQAVINALNAKELYLIHGPPGTGKTTTLVEVVMQLAKRGYRVLVSADSNTAVDNFLEKFGEYADKEGINYVRIGSISRINKRVYERSLDYMVYKELEYMGIENIYKEIELKELELAKYTKPTPSNRRGLSNEEILKLSLIGKSIRGLSISKIKSMAKYIKLKRELDILKDRVMRHKEKVIKSILSSCSVVFSTNSTSGSDLLKGEEFDVVIVDEATQSTEPSSLIPLIKGKKAVLAGDHRQLPPTILSEKARKEGLEVSMFERFMHLYKEQSLMLRIQYRMNEKIMGFSNALFYDQNLVAHESVKHHSIESIGIISDAPITFINVEGKEKRKGDSTSLYNEEEAKIVKAVVEELLRNHNQQDIGVISPYQDQVELIKKMLSKYSDVEVKTVDGFQGREKDVIVLSLVRTSPHTIGFLDDYRRLNVAITRARKKLIVVGNEKALRKDDVYKAFIEYVKREGEYIERLEGLI